MTAIVALLAGRPAAVVGRDPCPQKYATPRVATGFTEIQWRTQKSSLRREVSGTSRSREHGNSRRKSLDCAQGGVASVVTTNDNKLTQYRTAQSSGKLSHYCDNRSRTDYYNRYFVPDTRLVQSVLCRKVPG
ncbi:hypothetical protein J6590_006974 [Homalodisca vitripennis]|nr:hypothetical protein J6590_006974 [Homalodisca vitripennis]